MNPLYLLVPAVALDEATLGALAAVHQQHAPGCRLSVSWNVDRTEGLVKVTADPADPAIAPLLALYPSFTKETHADVLALLATPAWAAPDDAAYGGR